MRTPKTQRPAARGGFECGPPRRSTTATPTWFHLDPNRTEGAGHASGGPGGVVAGRAMLTTEGTAGAKPRLYILHALDFLVRAFHALAPLETTKGTQTGAIYGLCQMILRIE